jgi:hypothetical protein
MAGLCRSSSSSVPHIGPAAWACLKPAESGGERRFDCISELTKPLAHRGGPYCSCCFTRVVFLGQRTLLHRLNFRKQTKNRVHIAFKDPPCLHTQRLACTFVATACWELMMVRAQFQLITVFLACFDVDNVVTQAPFVTLRARMFDSQ